MAREKNIQTNMVAESAVLNYGHKKGMPHVRTKKKAGRLTATCRRMFNPFFAQQEGQR